MGFGLGLATPSPKPKPNPNSNPNSNPNPTEYGNPNPNPNHVWPRATLTLTANPQQVCYLYAEYAEDASGKDAVRVDVQDEGPGDLGW